MTDQKTMTPEDVVAYGKAMLSTIHLQMALHEPEDDETSEGVEELHLYLHASNDLHMSQQRQIESLAAQVVQLAALLDEECRRNLELAVRASS